MTSIAPPAEARPPRRWPALLGVTAAWLLAARYLLPLGIRLAPGALQQAVSLSTFRAVVQLVTLGAGLWAALSLVPEGRRLLGLRRPSPGQLSLAVAAAPVVVVLATLIGLWVAMPVLLEELATRGPGASRQNAGAFGRELAQAPALSALVWGALLAGAGEELLFRGALWGLVSELLGGGGGRVVPDGTSGDDEASLLATPPPSARLLATPPPSARLIAAVRGGVRGGLVATLVSALVFGLMHADLPGGVGLMRVVSTTCLGLASGLARQFTGSVLVCIALHATYNTLTLAQTRGWLGSRTVSLLETPLPVPLAVLAASGAALLVGVALVAWRNARSARS